uniref:Uncharacterized protein n=1 Tax=Aegilops tauschii TaxID=37682 RepID=M8C5M7_AEGTA
MAPQVHKALAPLHRHDQHKRSDEEYKRKTKNKQGARDIDAITELKMVPCNDHCTSLPYISATSKAECLLEDSLYYQKGEAAQKTKKAYCARAAMAWTSLSAPGSDKGAQHCGSNLAGDAEKKRQIYPFGHCTRREARSYGDGGGGRWEAGGDGFQFLADPVHRFPLPDLAAGGSLLRSEAKQAVVHTPAESSICDVGDAAPTPDSTTIFEHRLQWDGPVGAELRAIDGQGRSSAAWLDQENECLEKTLRRYVVPAVGSHFNSLGEAYVYYNLYSRDTGFGITYGKSRLNVERINACRRYYVAAPAREASENYEERRTKILHASDMYTRAMFEKFGEIMYEAGQYKVEELSSSALAVSDEHDLHLQFLPSDDHVAGGSAPGHAAFVQDTVYGRADGVSMADEGCEDESQVQSRSSTVEEVGTYDPENQSYAGGDNWSKTGSYSELRTKVADGSISGVDGERRAAKRARVED